MSEVTPIKKSNSGYYKLDQQGNRKGIYRVCPICTSKFYVQPAWIRLGRGQFCSKKCAEKILKKVGVQ